LCSEQIGSIEVDVFENTKADSYSFGVILWEIETGQVPFEGYDDKGIKNLIVIEKMRLKIPKYSETNLAKLIRRCWSENPVHRPDFKEILSMLDKVTFNQP
jgi:serine/threonine protein kinase